MNNRKGNGGQPKVVPLFEGLVVNLSFGNRDAVGLHFNQGEIVLSEVYEGLSNVFRIEGRFTLPGEQNSGSICFLCEIAGNMKIAPVDFDRDAKKTRLGADTERTMGVARFRAHNHRECLKLHDAIIPNYTRMSSLAFKSVTKTGRHWGIEVSPPVPIPSVISRPQGKILSVKLPS